MNEGQKSLNFFVTLSFSTPPFSSRSFSLTLGLFCLLLKAFFFLCVLCTLQLFLKIETRKLFHQLFCINPAASPNTQWKPWIGGVMNSLVNGRKWFSWPSSFWQFLLLSRFSNKTFSFAPRLSSKTILWLAAIGQSVCRVGLPLSFFSLTSYLSWSRYTVINLTAAIFPCIFLGFFFVSKSFCLCNFSFFTPCSLPSQALSNTKKCIMFCTVTP